MALLDFATSTNEEFVNESIRRVARSLARLMHIARPNGGAVIARRPRDNEDSSEFLDRPLAWRVLRAHYSLWITEDGTPCRGFPASASWHTEKPDFLMRVEFENLDYGGRKLLLAYLLGMLESVTKKVAENTTGIF